jgi:hypothetical protein
MIQPNDPPAPKSTFARVHGSMYWYIQARAGHWAWPVWSNTKVVLPATESPRQWTRPAPYLNQEVRIFPQASNLLAWDIGK